MEKAFLEALGLHEDTVEAVLREHEKARLGWEEKYQELQFQAVLESAVAAARGRNAKAIGAMLDVQALRASDDPRKAVKEALKALRQEHGYLFESPRPPAYAAGTGTGNYAPEAPKSLAGALKEKFQR